MAPFFNTNGSVPIFSNSIPISPLYLESIVPGALGILIFVFRPLPLVGLACSSVPNGIETAHPEHANTVSPGIII